MSQIQNTKTISITSGKGGVGKSTLVCNLATQMARAGKRVLILDGDMGLANIDIHFGVRPEFSIEDVMNGDKTVSEVIQNVAPHISLIPGGSGVYQLVNMNAFQRQAILDQVGALESAYDVMLIDTASGIDDNVIYLNSAAQEIVVVATPEPSSLTDAYALIKVLNQRTGETRFSVISNMVQDESEGLWVYRRLSDVSQKFLNVSLDYKGFIPMDLNLRAATKSQQLVTRENPQTPASVALRGISEKLCAFNGMNFPKGGMQFFWGQLVGQAS